jgi:hypothetical protein
MKPRSSLGNTSSRAYWAGCALAFLLALHPSAFGSTTAEESAAKRFHTEVEPILTKYCSDCHADGMKKGKVAFDELGTDEALLAKDELWFAVLKNLRAGIMPPHSKPRPSPEEQKQLFDWIKYEAFGIDPKNIDPGRVTVRRLNRIEYRNTIRDLLGVEFNTEGEFPPDDTGHGFDNIGDVLTISPMLLEKYLAAARTVVADAVPTTGKTVPEKSIAGGQFRRGEDSNEESDRGRRNTLSLSYYEPAAVSNVFRAEHSGKYRLVLDLTANERHVEAKSDYNKCRLIFKVDGRQLLTEEHGRQGGKAVHHEVEVDWQPGEHQLTFELQPLTPDQTQVRSLTLRIESVKVQGPLDEKYWVRPKNHQRFFPKDAPATAAERRVYAAELLNGFARKAYRRPVDRRTTDRLAALAESVYTQPGKAFEAGVAHAMVAVLASPRFIFREEATIPPPPGKTHPLIDEYALASRLSYFLWSSMPDAELFRLAAAGELRKNLPAQVKRMLADSRSKAFIQNFTGQWLHARDIESVVIEARSVLSREEKTDPERERKRARFRELRNKPDESLTAAEKEEIARMREEFVRRSANPRADLTGELRRSMRQETEKYFEHIIRENRPLEELIDSDYTFLNERLAKHYGVEGVTGDELRLVKLPPDSPRGGVLSHGTVLAVTSNPTRTSPVKRGVFILDNILGTPAPPPPPDIPPLEDAAKAIKDREPTLRETLEMHRRQPLCNACHNRMDPLGLAMENFNAMGMWREQERDQPLEVAGKLLTGESFTNVRELKRILATERRQDFYRCLTEKLLTYALGRGVEHYDVESVDKIVERLESGRFSALLMGVIESEPFQKRRSSGMVTQASKATTN